MPPPPLCMPAPACSGQPFLAHHRCAATIPISICRVASMHAAYEEEDEHVLQHAGEEELACHCRLRLCGGGAHGGCRDESRSRPRRASKLGADAESTFE